MRDRLRARFPRTSSFSISYIPTDDNDAQPTIGVVAHHFARKRALAIGVAFTGSSLGGVVFAIALNNMFRPPPTGLGFANGVRVAAAICGALMLAANALMRTEPRVQRTKPAVAVNPLKFARDFDYVLGVLSCVRSRLEGMGADLDAGIGCRVCRSRYIFLYSISRSTRACTA